MSPLELLVMAQPFPLGGHWNCSQETAVQYQSLPCFASASGCGFGASIDFWSLTCWEYEIHLIFLQWDLLELFSMCFPQCLSVLMEVHKICSFFDFKLSLVNPLAQGQGAIPS